GLGAGEDLVEIEDDVPGAGASFRAQRLGLEHLPRLAAVEDEEVRGLDFPALRRLDDQPDLADLDLRLERLGLVLGRGGSRNQEWESEGDEGGRGEIPAVGERAERRECREHWESLLGVAPAGGAGCGIRRTPSVPSIVAVFCSRHTPRMGGCYPGRGGTVPGPSGRRLDCGI